MRRIEEDALRSAVMHLTGRSRAFIQEVEAALHEIGSLRDERSARLVEALDLTLREPAGTGTLRHVERLATELLRTLRTEAEG